MKQQLVNPDTHKQEKDASFNPIAWGILFFTFWLSLRTVGEAQNLQLYLSWLFLSLSIILWLSIFIPPLRALLNRKYSVRFILPIIFYVSIFAFLLSWMGSWSSLEGWLRSLSIIIGFLWILAYLFILVRITNRPMGIFVAIVFICLAIYRFINCLILDGILSVLLGTAILVIAIWRPRIWHELKFG